MTKVENLEKRVTKLDGKTSSTDDAGGARWAWLFHHLTEDELIETARCTKRLETDPADREAGERMRGLLEKAQIRGDTRPGGVREEFYQKHSRREEIRRMSRVLTDAEHDELLALNDWFEKFRQDLFEQRLEAGVKELKENSALAKAEGLDD